MAKWYPSDWLQIPHNGEYGNLSNVIGSFALGTGIAALDTIDFVKIPAGATVVEGFISTTAMTGTATACFGVRYADGTSTGGTTGTAVLLLGTFTGAQRKTALSFTPFTNDADTILYATHVSGPAWASGDRMDLIVQYVANGTK